MIHIKHEKYDRKKILIEEWPAFEAVGWVKMEPWERAVIPWHIDREQAPVEKERKPGRPRSKKQPPDEDYTS